MYLLPQQVIESVSRRYQQITEIGVIDEVLRGWAWSNPPLSPPYDIKLPLNDIVLRYCESLRDVYLKYVEGVTRPPLLNMVTEELYRATVALVVQNAKRLLYSMDRIDYTRLGTELITIREKMIDDLMRKIASVHTINCEKDWESAKWREDIIRIWNFETDQIVDAVKKAVEVNPLIGTDALVNNTIPIVIGQCLDGSRVGLSGHISTDSFGTEGVVLDIKTGQERRFHRLVTTGHALVIESTYGRPVDLGCIVYCWSEESAPPRLKYDVHEIDEHLRREFVETRDTALKIVAEEREPGLPESCYERCPYWDYCH